MVCVAIPIYKEVLSKYEKISLMQCLNILHKYSIIFFHPKSLDLSSYHNLIQESNSQIRFYSFDDDYFESIAGYNRLLLSKDFYKTFKEFKYMLIYQLDAFVFKDELEYWCNQGYDYIGSPWIYEDFIHSYRGIHVPIWTKAHWSKKINYGGNGGFSLRKISSFIFLLNFFGKEAKNSNLNEDGFWSFCSIRYNPFFKVAPCEFALKFAFERFPEKSYETIKNNLPFGCHAWEKYNIEFWQPYIKDFGHKIV